MGDTNGNGNSNNDSKANLARIRDNQRRSRARRKEYLQELESKYRQCEQIGVAATAEMQLAARKVLEENRKLRALLRSRGVSEDDIDAATGADSEWLEEGPPSDQLDYALKTRKPCCPGSGNDNALGAACSPGGGTSPALAPQLQHPLSAGLHPPPQLASLSLNSVPLSPPPGASPITAPVMTFSMGYHQPVQTATSYPYPYPTDAQWQSYEPQPATTQAPLDYSNTSCVDAANIIRNMRGGVGPELEADLGCQQPGVVCKVENTVVFEVMEKYASQGTDAWK